MPSYSGTITSSQGTRTLDVTPRDVITFTPTSGTYTVEYPIGTVAISASAATQSLIASTSATQMRVSCLTGSVSYSSTDNTDSLPVSTVAYWSPADNGVANASATTAAMNASLAAGGYVYWAGSGQVFINDPIIIPANTHLKVSPTLEIVLTGGTAKNLITSSAYQRIAAASWISATPTWTAGRSLSVARTAHGLTAGQYIFVFSTSLAPTTPVTGFGNQFLGVFPISAVTDADNFVIRLHRTPNSAPTGTFQYIVADVGITVEGGIWNQNFPTNAFGTASNNHAMIFGGVAHLRVKDVRCKNVSKYCVNVGGAYDWTVDGLAADISSSDVFKGYGPLVQGQVCNVSGFSVDDVVSLQTKEAAAFSVYMWTFGDIHNNVVENISAQANVGVATMYFSVTEYCGSNIFRNISGSGGAGRGVAITAGYSNAYCDDITIDCTNGGGTHSFRVNAQAFTGCVINNLEIRGWRFEPDTYASNRQGILSDAGVSVNNWVMTNPVVNSGVWPSGTTFLWQIGSPIGTFSMSGGSFSGLSNVARLAQFTGGVVEANIKTSRFTSTWSVVFEFTTAGTPTVNVEGCDFNNLGAVVSTAVAATVNLFGNRFNVGANGVVRANAAVAINVKSASNNYVGGSVITNGSGTGDWRVYGWDMPINLNTTGINKTVAGQFCFSNTLAGTLAANRLAHCNGTNFLQLDTPANVF